jgi:hypothetical protein
MTTTTQTALSALDTLIRDAYDMHLRDHKATPLFRDCQNPYCQFAYAAKLEQTALRARLEAAERERDRLRVALEWYADDGNYMTEFGDLATAYENGKLAIWAREALAQEGE